MEEVQLAVFYTYWKLCIVRQMDSPLRLISPVQEAGGCAGPVPAGGVAVGVAVG